MPYPEPIFDDDRYDRDAIPASGFGGNGHLTDITADASARIRQRVMERLPREIRDATQPTAPRNYVLTEAQLDVIRTVQGSLRHIPEAEDDADELAALIADMEGQYP